MTRSSGVCLAPLVFASALVAGCAHTDEQVTPAEWLEENSSILNDLASYDTARRQEAVIRFRQLDKERATAVILSILSDNSYDDYRVEVVLARLLADYRDERAVPHLLRFLQHPDDGAVRIAIEGLSVFRDSTRLRDALLELLDSPSPRDRLTAVDLFHRLGTEDIVPALAESYRGERDRIVRGAILRSVLESSFPRRTEFLVDALTDSDPALRELAWNALRSDRRVPRVAFDPDGTEADRAIAVGELRTWLRTRNQPR